MQDLKKNKKNESNVLLNNNEGNLWEIINLLGYCLIIKFHSWSYDI